MDIEQAKDKYADLLVNSAIALHPGQKLLIESEIIHSQLVNMITEKAYQQGASLVNVEYIDPRVNAARALLSSQENLSIPRIGRKAVYDEISEEGGARILIEGMEDLNLSNSIPSSSISALEMTRQSEMKKYYKDALPIHGVSWTMACAATPNWAKQVFPELDIKLAETKLWEHLFSFARVDKKDYLGFWPKQKKKLDKRSKTLNKLDIKTLNFIGPDTDLKVGISEKAKFQSPGVYTQKGALNFHNIPSEECYTTPNYHLTEGKVSITRPVVINGKIVEGLTLLFKEGEIIDFSATKNEEAFKEFVESEIGTKFLGEVALVGSDSPIYESGKVFYEILLDENAACHIALGEGFKDLVSGAIEATDTELENLGVNMADQHLDLMISSHKTSVIATTRNNEEILLIKNGKFVI